MFQRRFYISLMFSLVTGIIWNKAHSQDSAAVSGKDTVSIHRDSSSVPETWQKYYLGLHLGGGAQKAFYGEVGLCLQRFIYEARHGYMATTFYGAFEWTPAAPGRIA